MPWPCATTTRTPASAPGACPAPAGRAFWRAACCWPGCPFGLKDLQVALKGTVTTHGSVFFRDAVADHDSTLVQRYQAAGLNIFAKFTSPEFGQTATTESRLFGATRNPGTRPTAPAVRPAAAAAVAAGIVPVAHASDGGGSIRIRPATAACSGSSPAAAWCRWPEGPGGLDGPVGNNVISRSVRDSALLLQLSQGPEAGSRVRPPTTICWTPSASPRGLRIALLETNPSAWACMRIALDAVHRGRACARLGHQVEPPHRACRFRKCLPAWA